MLSLPLLALAAVAPVSPPATVIEPLFFSEMVDRSARIVVGTATTSKCRYERGRRTIATYVTFEDLVVYKGATGNSRLTLRFEGGRIGDDVLQVPGMPKFRRGARYLLFVCGTCRFSAITGFRQGCFQIIRRGGREVLVAQGGAELVGVRDDRLVFVPRPTRSQTGRRSLPGHAGAAMLPKRAPRPWRSRSRSEAVPIVLREDPGTRVTVGQLMAGLRARVRRSEGR